MLIRPADNRPTITLASGIYDITRPLIHGLVDVEGARLNVLADFRSVDEIFRRMLNLEFDASEMSTSHYLLARERGIPLIAVPVFLNRLFPHSYLFRSKKSSAKTPKDLAGRRVGLPQYQATRPMWVRGIFEEEYGLKKTEVTWVTDFPEKMEVKTAPGVRVEKAPAGKTLGDMLADGELDAAMCWAKPESDQVDSFFPDTRAEEAGYYQKTGMFPIMHTVVLKEDLYEKHPWMARSIVQAYTQSKLICYEWRDRVSGGSMPVAKYGLADQRALLGEDPFPFDLKSNLKVLGTSARYSAAEGFIKPVSDVSALWIPDVETR